ncbi:MAG TPA: hypothetical protein DEB09_01915 [Candidatus Magasanikbacteria bacterium]|nr:hypothetical protein [Candidatus Magasanikbacteria bacterium]
MDLRKKIFIIIGAILAFVLLIFLYFFFLSKPSTPGNNEDALTNDKTGTNNTNNIKYNSPGTNNTGEIIKEDPEKLSAKQTARTFVERFGSYSNQNDNEHIADAILLSTTEMVDWLETQKLDKSYDYSGMTTRVISMSVEKIDENSATVLVDTQQLKEIEMNKEIGQRSGRVELLKVNGDWKVDGFFWDK